MSRNSLDYFSEQAMRRSNLGPDDEVLEEDDAGTCIKAFVDKIGLHYAQYLLSSLSEVHGNSMRG